MKNMLSMLATLTLATTGMTPIIRQTIISESQKELNSILAAKDFYWYGDHRKAYEFSSTYPARGQHSRYFCVEIALERTNIFDYTWISAINPNNESYSKTSWGNDAYWGTSFANAINDSVISDVISNKRIVTDRDVENYANIKLLSRKDKQGLASMETAHYVGLSYYSENGNNYLQVFGYQYVNTWKTSSGGGMWTNLGRGIRLS